MNRIDILKALIKDRFDGSQAEFARAIRRSPGQVGQWLGGHRQLGDAGARIIELALELPSGYFDSSRAEETRKPYTANVKKLPKKEDARIAEVKRLMNATDDIGRAMALAAVKVALANHKPAKANPAS